MATWQSSLNLLAFVAIVGTQPTWMKAALAQDATTVNTAVSAELGVLEAEFDFADLAFDSAFDLAQASIEISDIQVEATEAGLDLILEASGELATPSQAVAGNALVLEISNATLAEELEEFAPAEGIALVQATMQDDTVRIAITGRDAPPTVEVSSTASGLTLNFSLGVARAGADDDAITLGVTGEDIDDYVVPDASTATRTDTPLRDTPQSIQVIPQAVLEDQGVVGLNDAIRNVSGVVTTNVDPRSQTFSARGFNGVPVLRDGMRSFNSSGSIGFAELSNIEQVEVLKGPASILVGAVEPGGAINLVGERPLGTPAYELSLRVGNRELIEPSLDLTGPLDEAGRVRYRINALYRNEDYYRDFEQPIERFFVAPMVSVAIGDDTDLLLEVEHRRDERPYDPGIVAVGDGVADIPFDRALAYPDLKSSSNSTRVGIQLEHRFSDSWRIRNSTYYTRFDTSTFTNSAFTLLGSFFDEASGNVSLIPGTFDQPSSSFEVQTNVVGEFSTGSIEHTLLAGADFYVRRDLGTEGNVALGLAGGFPRPTVLDFLNINDPDYNALTDFDADDFLTASFTEGRTEGWGFYLQNQVELLDNLILLAGLRFDTVFQDLTLEAPLFGIRNQSDSTSDAFTPRVGLVYQPSEEVSLYASYSQSFQPNTGVIPNL